MELLEIGRRIKTARLKMGFTQQELANRCGVTKSLLSKIENGQTSSALATLSRISDNLKTPLSWFLDGDNEQPINIIKHKNRKEKIGNDDMGYMYATLANRSRFSNIEPMILTVLPNAEVKEPFTHSEDEFIYIISGSVNLWYNNEIHDLEEGDSVYFEGSIPHKFISVSDQEAKVLSIFIKPTL